MERLVDNLPDMSTAEFGRADIRPEPCHLAEQVRYATELFRAHALSKSQTITESLDLPEEDVLADVQRLRNDGLSDVSDPVTGLPSRHRFLRELQQGVDGVPVRSALIIRVGRLNRINEEYGYGRGNETMRQVSRSPLRRCCAGKTNGTAS
ncbi:MAG: GGDEF domain-containing protein [Oscillospiraceae bacterium]|nr:GGDEF domain-containing protein [Oscillospiraceae bacterium]